jgi:glycosyltransferase involved in cell wall biosynthesis
MDSTPPKNTDRPFTMIDGFSLSLSQGTGIATYARGVAHALNAMNHRVGVLYGRPIERSAPPLLKEVGLYDEVDEDRPMTWSKQAMLNLAPISSPTLTFDADHIPLTGTVVTEQARTRVPEGAEAWNVNSLYDIAHRQFALWRKFTTVRMPNPPKVMHWTYPLPVRMAGAKNIYTLHDLVPLRLPYTTLDNKRRYYRMVKQIADTADHIVTVSECSKRDIMNLLGVPEHRITNTYQSVHIPEAMLKPTEQDIADEVANVYGLGYKEFFLFYGALEPKKNVIRLVQAYLASGVSTPLIIVGPKAWGTETKALALDIENGMYGGRIRRLKYVPLPALITLIRAAKATLFPSLYEGFGLPVLESMMLGTPVLSSNVSSIPEVAGDGALLVNPYDTNAIRDGIRAMDSDEGLRSALTDRGRRQVAYVGLKNYDHALQAKTEIFQYSPIDRQK